MDEDEYRDIYAELNTLPCAFQKALLTRRYACRHEQRINIGEREAIGCRNALAYRECTALLVRVRQAGRFAVKQTHMDAPFAHPKELKLQCGTVLGLAAMSATAATTNDIYGLIEEACACYGSLDQLPYVFVVQAIAAFEPRQRRGKSR